MTGNLLVTFFFLEVPLPEPSIVPLWTNFSLSLYLSPHTHTHKLVLFLWRTLANTDGL